MLYKLIFWPSEDFEVQSIVTKAKTEKEAVNVAIKASIRCFKKNWGFQLSESTKHQILDCTKNEICQKGNITGVAKIYRTDGAVINFDYDNVKGIKSVYNKASQKHKQIKVLFITKEIRLSKRPTKPKTSALKVASQLLTDENLANQVLLKFKNNVKAKDERIVELSKKKPGLKDYLKDIPVLYNMILDYVKGNYKEIPTLAIVGITAVVLYFVFPVDLIPDFIPGIGYSDDISILFWGLDKCHTEIDKYKQWQHQRG